MGVMGKKKEKKGKECKRSGERRGRRFAAESAEKYTPPVAQDDKGKAVSVLHMADRLIVVGNSHRARVDGEKGQGRRRDKQPSHRPAFFFFLLSVSSNTKASFIHSFVHSYSHAKESTRHRIDSHWTRTPLSQTHPPLCTTPQDSHHRRRA